MSNGTIYTHISEELNQNIAEAMKLYENFLAGAKKLGFDVRLTPTTKTLELYFHDDYPDLLLVDKYQDRADTKETLMNLLEENAPNLEDSSDCYAKGYHDAIVDVMNAFHVAHTESYFD